MKDFSPSMIRSLFNDVYEEAALLLYPGKHMALLSTRRAAITISRVRLICMLLAILTSICIIPDLLTLPWPLSEKLAIGRFFASMAFVIVALLFHSSTRMSQPFIGVGPIGLLLLLCQQLNLFRSTH